MNENDAKFRAFMRGFVRASGGRTQKNTMYQDRLHLRAAYEKGWSVGYSYRTKARELGVELYDPSDQAIWFTPADEYERRKQT